MSSIETVFGMIFASTEGHYYGVIRSAGESRPPELESDDVLAADGSGNYFLRARDGSIVFWDHETADRIRLTDSIAAFVSRCAPIETLPLPNARVTSSWVDPEFAKELEIQAATKKRT